MLRADLVGKRIVIDGVQYRDREPLKTLPGHSYRDQVHSIPLSWPSLRVLLATFDEVEVGDELSTWAWVEHDTRIGPASEAHDLAMDPENDAPGPSSLYPYQRTGVDFLVTAESAALTDDMGVGKTIESIMTLELRNAYPALVVCPKTAKGGWLREFNNPRWGLKRDVVIVGGSITQRRKQLAEQHDVYLMTWESLRYHSRLKWWPGSPRLKACSACGGGDPKIKEATCERHAKELNGVEWKAIIADEAHRAIDPKAKQTAALWAVAHQQACVRIPLTGTPIANDTADFWSLLHFVAPDDWPSRTEYVDRYCQTILGTWGGVEVIGLNPLHADEFHALVKPRHLRRPKKLVLPWLPPKVYEPREVDMSPAQARTYHEIEEECISSVEGGTVVAIDPLTTATRLTQAASATLVVDEEGRVRLAAPSTKVDALVELLEDMGPTEPLVVFAESSQLIELAAERLEKEGITFSKIIGGQSDLKRYGEEMEFMEGRARVILLTLGAGSESLTLTRASVTCFMQRSWSMIKNKQAEDRTDRPGQEAEKIVIVDLVAPNTIEEDQQEAIRAKSDQLEEIVQDRQALLNAVLRRRSS